MIENKNKSFVKIERSNSFLSFKDEQILQPDSINYSKNLLELSNFLKSNDKKQEDILQSLDSGIVKSNDQ